MYVWKVMLFGHMNPGATYQRVVHMIFHDMIGKEIEVYIGDIVVKSVRKKDHLTAL